MARFATVLILLALIPWGIFAQNTDDGYAEYEDAMRDLVERYENTRELLRREIARNADLFTQDELDAAVVSAEEDLSADLTEAQAMIAEMEDAYKAIRIELKNARDEARAYKAALAKTSADAEATIDGLELTLDSIEEESLIQLGATFSPAGALGMIGMINLPDTNVSLLSGFDYTLRERELSARFGVTLSFLPQRQLVQGWQRLSARFGNRAEDKAEEYEDLEAASETAATSAEELLFGTGGTGDTDQAGDTGATDVPTETDQPTTSGGPETTEGTDSGPATTSPDGDT